MEDRFLPRLVTVGLIVLTTVILAIGGLLKLRGVDGSDFVALGGTGLGALAGFLSRDRLTPAPVVTQD